MTSNYAYTCGNCGKDIMQGQWHTCQMGGGSASSPQYYQWPYVDQRTVNALERIANALERMNAAAPKCSICGKYSEWYTTAPYGSDRDGDVICAGCLGKALDKIKESCGNER